MKRLLYSIIVFSVFKVCPLWAEEMQCPLGLGYGNTKQSVIKQSFSGWLAYERSAGHSLQDVDIYEGNPSKLSGEYWFDVSENDDGKLKSEAFVDLTKMKDPWMTCSYYSTTVTLNKPIPKLFKKCFKVFSRSSPDVPFRFENIRCE